MPLPAMEAHKIDPTTGEDEMALALAGAETLARHGIGRAGAGVRAARGGRGAHLPRQRQAQSAGPDELGQGRPQRAVPLRLRQEIQALPRRYA